MKLDKIKFAQVIGFIQRQYAISFSYTELSELDNMIDVEVPQADVAYPNSTDVNNLIALMAGGPSISGPNSSKIDAIKLHRKITGYGLKESKDIVEKYWKPVDSPS